MEIIVISAHAAERTALQQLLSEDGHHVIAVATHLEGLALARKLSAEVVIADVRLPWLDGAALMRELSALGVQARVILLCSRASCKSENGLMCLTKPIDLGQLHRHIAPLEHTVSRVA